MNNAVINNTIRGTNGSFVNACFMNVSIVNMYCDPAMIDNCSFTHNVCMNNYSVVNLEISGNVSFQNLKTLNSVGQNLS